MWARQRPVPERRIARIARDLFPHISVRHAGESSCRDGFEVQEAVECSPGCESLVR